jgi:F420-0:gamma-glutamyl ligase
VIPLRAGVVGVALGYAGFRGLREYRGEPDIFGYPLKVTRTNIADGLATAAVLMMGEGNEQQPLATIRHARVQFSDRTDRRELSIAISDDLYAPLFLNMTKTGRKKKAD